LAGGIAGQANAASVTSGSWVHLVSWCHKDVRHQKCDVLPIEVRRDYHLGSRPARMIVPNGDTAYIVADFRGHVKIIDQS
jgi:hypothetical protein